MTYSSCHTSYKRKLQFLFTPSSFARDDSPFIDPSITNYPCYKQVSRCSPAVVPVFQGRKPRPVHQRCHQRADRNEEGIHTRWCQRTQHLLYRFGAEVRTSWIYRFPIRRQAWVCYPVINLFGFLSSTSTHQKINCSYLCRTSCISRLQLNAL